MHSAEYTIIHKISVSPSICATVSVVLRIAVLYQKTAGVVTESPSTVGKCHI